MNWKLLFLVIALVLVGILAVPLAAIWSVNTLFGTAIEVTWRTWMASLILCAVVGGSYTRK